MEHLTEKTEECFTLTIQEGWFVTGNPLLRECCRIYKLKVEEDLGEYDVMEENDEGVMELVRVHGYKVKKI